MKEKLQPKPRQNLTTLYKTLDFQQHTSSFDAFSLIGSKGTHPSKNLTKVEPLTEKVLIDKNNKHIKNNEIKIALERLEKVALRSPSVKTHKSRSDTKEKLRQRSKRKSEKNFKVKLYNFMLPENHSKNKKVKCPPFNMLLEHTIGVLLLIFTRRDKTKNNLRKFTLF